MLTLVCAWFNTLVIEVENDAHPSLIVSITHKTVQALSVPVWDAGPDAMTKAQLLLAGLGLFRLNDQMLKDIIAIKEAMGWM